MNQLVQNSMEDNVNAIKVKLKLILKANTIDNDEDPTAGWELLMNYSGNKYALYPSSLASSKGYRTISLE